MPLHVSACLHSRCINHCGAIMPELKDRNPTEEEVTVALETLTKAVVKQWSLGYCGNDVITVYSKEHKRVSKGPVTYRD